MIGWRDNNDGHGEAYRQATSERPGLKIRCILKMDQFKSNWFLWEAEREWIGIDGIMRHESGTVQADYQGESIAQETWEPEE